MPEPLRIGVGQTVLAARALEAVAPEDARLALRAVLCSSHEDLLRFDAAWEEDAARHLPPAAALPQVGGDPAPPGADDAEDPELRPSAWSAVELLRERDLATLDDAERAVVRSLLVRLARRGPTRRSRRLRPTAARGGRPDVARTMRAALRRGGEPVDRRFRAPVRAARPLVLVLDVSGSMAPYARMLLVYVQAAVAARRRVEAFALGTRLTRVTRELAGRDPDAALERAAGAVADWAGGTRLGEGLATLTREHGGRLGRGAVVVVLSDGWDRGDPELLSAEMARLSRVAHRVVWLNPLKARPGYEPLARGMAAALPHVDHFLAGDSLASLEELADLLEEGIG